MTADRQFVRLESQLEASWVIRAADRTAGLVEAAAGSSSTARLFGGLRRRFLAAAIVGRGQAIAAFAATAALTHMTLVRAVPAHIAPALPSAFWIALAAIAVIVLVSAERVATAWSGSAVQAWWFRASRRFPAPRK